MLTCLVLALVLEGLGLVVTAREPAAWDSLWLLGAALAGQLASPRLPGFGRLQLGTPFALALLVRPGTWMLGTLPLGAVQLLQGTPRETLAAWLPLLVAGTARVFIHDPWVALLVALHLYLLASWAATPYLAAEALGPGQAAGWRTVAAVVSPAQLGLAYLSLAVAGPWSLLGLVPLGLAFRALAEAAPLLAEARHLEGVRRQVDLDRLGLRQARRAQEHVTSQLEVKSRQLAQLEGLARALARNPDRDNILERVLELARQQSGCQSAVLFDLQLVPVRWLSPQSQRLGSAGILRLTEPIVEQAQRLRQPVRLTEDGEQRLMAGERAAAAFPMENLGVLYLGDSRRPPFTDEEVQGLRTLVAQAALSLQSAVYFSHLQTSVAEYQAANGLLERWSHGLGRVLHTAQSLTSTLDPAGLAALLEEGVRAVVGGELVWLVGEGSAPPSVVAEVAGVVQASGRPLLFETLEGTRFATPGLGSLMAAPLGARATLVVASPQAGHFDRLTQDLLQVLSLHAATALENAHAHEQVVEAYHKLQRSEAQLVQTAKLAAVGQLAAGIAHELNTPLGAVNLGIDTAMTQLDKKPEVAKKRLLLAQSAGLKARDIVAKLLYYSREGAHKKVSFDPAQVVRDTLSMVGQQLRLDGLELEVHLEPGGTCVGNANEIQQVLLNLLLNARDALRESPEKKVILRAGREGREFTVSVSDLGPGMPAEVRERVFEPFFTTKPVGQGTGLGLSISHEIVTQHGGTLSVQSESGQGATFRLALPLQE